MKKFLKGLLRNPRRSSTNKLQRNCWKSSFESWEKNNRKKIDGPEFMNLQPKVIKYHIMNYEVIFTIFELSVTGSDRASNSQIWNHCRATAWISWLFSHISYPLFPFWRYVSTGWKPISQLSTLEHFELIDLRAVIEYWPFFALVANTDQTETGDIFCEADYLYVSWIVILFLFREPLPNSKLPYMNKIYYSFMIAKLQHFETCQHPVL